MNKIEFANKVREDYPNLPDSFFKRFSEFCGSFKEADYNRIYHQFNRTKFYGSVPTVQDFYQAAKDLGIQEKINPSLKYSAFKCNDCGTLWEGEGHCPKCRQWTAVTVVASESPFDVGKGVPIGEPVRGDVFVKKFSELILAKNIKKMGGE